MAEAGSGPMVLLLHGFPTFWWTWRALLPVLAAAGYRAVAMDLRGYAGSDHTPHGYDPFTLADDAAGVIRSLGEAEATVVGHGWGGLIAWTMAVTTPEVVSGIVPVSMPHPRLLRPSILGRPAQLRRSWYAVGFQLPFAPEASLTRDNAARVEQLLRSWSTTPGWPDPATVDVYRTAMQLEPTAHCAVEYHRWALRSVLRTDGRRFTKRMAAPIEVPVLHLHGAADPSVLPATMQGSADYVSGPYSPHVLPGVGHFPHEEAPDEVATLLLDWLKEQR